MNHFKEDDKEGDLENPNDNRRFVRFVRFDDSRSISPKGGVHVDTELLLSSQQKESNDFPTSNAGSKYIYSEDVSVNAASEYGADENDSLIEGRASFNTRSSAGLLQPQAEAISGAFSSHWNRLKSTVESTDKQTSSPSRKSMVHITRRGSFSDILGNIAPAQMPAEQGNHSSSVQKTPNSSTFESAFRSGKLNTLPKRTEKQASAVKLASELLSPESKSRRVISSKDKQPPPAVHTPWQQQWVDFQDPRRLTPFALRFQDPLCEHLFERHRYEATKDLLIYFLLMMVISSVLNLFNFDAISVKIVNSLSLLAFSVCSGFLIYCRVTRQEDLSFKYSGLICGGFFLIVTLTSQVGLAVYVARGSSCSEGLGNWILMVFILPFVIAVTLQPDFRYVLVVVLMNAFYCWIIELIFINQSGAQWCLHTKFDLTLFNIIAIPVYYIRERSMRNQFVAQKVSELRLDEAKKDAQNANRVKRNFLSYIFHEIRVPLNAIAIGIDLLLDEQKGDTVDNPEESLPLLLKQQVENASHILDDVLSLQKIEEGRFEIEQEPFNIVQMLQTVAWTYSRISVEKQIELELKIDERLKNDKVIGDQFRLRQVVANFLSNALKFTPTGGSIKISAYVSKMDSKEPLLEVSVRDTGVGISTDDQERLFQPYVQISAGELQKGRGTGLGLNISKHIVRLHDGKIGVRSVQNVGSKFFFQIPYKTSMTATPDAQVSQNEEKKSQASISDQFFLGKMTSAPIYQHRNSNPATMPPSNATEVSPVSLEKKIERPFVSSKTRTASNAALSSQGKELGSEKEKEIEMPSTKEIAVPSTQTTASRPQSSDLVREKVKDIEKEKGREKEKDGEKEKCREKEKGGELLSVTSKVQTISDAPSCPQSGDSESKKASDSVKVQSPKIRPRRALIVEDSATNSKLIGRMVSKWNWDTSFAFNGQEAVQLFEQIKSEGKDDIPIDLVIMDKEMPVMHGDEAIRLIRAMGFQVPIVALTGNALDSERLKLEEAGSDAFLSKPTTMGKLKKTVATVFEAKGLGKVFPDV